MFDHANLNLNQYSCNKVGHKVETQAQKIDDCYEELKIACTLLMKVTQLTFIEEKHDHLKVKVTLTDPWLSD